MIDLFETIYRRQTGVHWSDFSQLIICSDVNRIFKVLNEYMAENELLLNDVTEDPSAWENALFIYERKWESDGKPCVATILSEPETPMEQRFVNDEFASVFMEFGQLDGVFISNDNHLSLLELMTFREGIIRMKWVDSPSAYQHIGAAFQTFVPDDENFVSDDDLPRNLGIMGEEALCQSPLVEGSVGFVEPLYDVMAPSFVEFYDEVEEKYHEDSAFDYMKRALGREKIEPFDELARYEFIEKVVSDFELCFSPSLELLKFKRVLQPFES